MGKQVISNKARPILISLCCIGVGLSVGSLVSAADSDFETFKQQRKAEVSQFNQSKNAEFKKFRDEYLAEFDAYRGELLKFWSVPEQSTSEVEVIYTQDKQTRVKIDALTQQVVIENLTDEVIDHDVVIRKLKADPNTRSFLANIESPAALADKETVLSILIDQPSEVIAEKVVNEQIDIQKQQMLSQLDAQQSIEDIEIEISAKITPSNARSLDANNKLKQVDEINQQSLKRKKIADNQVEALVKTNPIYKKIQVNTMRLPEDYLYKLSKDYLIFYQKQSSEMNIPLSLLLAISYAESTFDPKAKSHIPAFGLMQIVPRSAGMDVARKFYRKNQAPTSIELYQPNINISYGAGYLSILNEQYLDGIDDPTSRKYCVIAAYNTGAGNIAKTFNGGNNRSIKQAYSKINALSPDQVYSKLMKRLPYPETQKYLAKVSKLEAKYQHQINQWNLSE
ncbi:transglycosylase SLT domain-containing protein [Shewanella sp. SG44-2]|uniref:transglycosylase SLT domain-containing protein n=1 Tax=Shewanella sp. SG44-2 TaxID=2760962 RepID=UPI001603C9C6|nr:transglycosylase SLT domain-containing protein [Shewanella sp. SG44-2]MBB1425792.1 transglycosylase SLT domain-containing protein [Shewanella sp. SG44-2]